ncbi:hypothetical protein EMIT0162MI3_70045 [Pseudomonas chlororaphis]
MLAVLALQTVFNKMLQIEKEGIRIV